MHEIIILQGPHAWIQNWIIQNLPIESAVNYTAPLYFIAVYFLATGLTFLLHNFRAQITMAPLLAFAGLLTFLVWQLVQIGWWVDWQDYKINAAILGVIPALLIGATVTYAMDGVRTARAFQGVVLCGALSGMVYSHFIEALGRVTPMPAFFFAPLFTQIVLATSLIAAGFICALAFEMMTRISRIAAMPVGYAIGLASFLGLYSVLNYGVVEGWLNIRLESPEFLLMAGPAIVTLFVYGLMARQSNSLMPARRFSSMFWETDAQSHPQKPESIIASKEQISELRQLNRALQQEENLRYRQMLHSPLAMVELDRFGRLRRFNPAAQELLAKNSAGKFFVEGRDIEDYIPELKPLLQSPDLIQNNMLKHTLEMNLPDGMKALDITILPLLADQGICGYSLLAEDISARQQAERRRILNERVKGIHKTSQVIHHDFSNMMLAIQGHLHQIQNKLALQGDSDIEQAIQAIQSAGDRGRNMLGQLGAGRVFEKPELQEVNLYELIMEAVRLITPQAKSQNISVATALDQNIWVEADSNQILRVIINLLSNSIRAMPQGGSISVVAEIQQQGVQIQIQDTGVGMSGEQLSQAFDPGFSTKGQGQGGLGLAISYLITEAHGGRLSLESKKGIGTVAKIWLPLLSTSKSNDNFDFKTNIEAIYSGEGVLLLLSQNELRHRFAEQLQAAGCEVAELENYQELQATLADRPGEWTVLIRGKNDTIPPQLWHECRYLCDVVLDVNGKEPPRIRPSSKSKISANDLQRILRAA